MWTVRSSFHFILSQITQIIGYFKVKSSASVKLTQGDYCFNRAFDFLASKDFNYFGLLTLGISNEG